MVSQCPGHPAALRRGDGAYHVPMQTDDYLDAYRRSHDRHGSDFEVTLWASPQTQRRRFEVMARMTRLADRRVLDVGCSRGDMATFMLERGIDFEHYIGIDALAEVIEYARGRDLPRCEFHCADVLDDPRPMMHAGAEVVCISGTLNTMSQDQALALLEQAWAAAGRTLIFNFLSDRCGPEAPPQTYPARRFDTMAMLDWALMQTPITALRQDYLPHGHDATILMRRW